MKITALVENTTVSTKYKTRHGLSLYIETQNHKILFDMGPNALFLKNAALMGIDITAVDIAVISHGHKDHGGALKRFLAQNSIAKVYVRETAFAPYYYTMWGIPFNAGLNRRMKNHSRVVLTGEDTVIDSELKLFAGVTERDCYASSNNTLYTISGRQLVHDDFGHEQNLIVTENGQSVLIAGCCHSGIINILNKAERLCENAPVCAVGGFHLYDPGSGKVGNDALAVRIGQKLQCHDAQFYTCHCTGQRAYRALKGVMGDQIHYLSTGDSIQI